MIKQGHRTLSVDSWIASTSFQELRKDSPARQQHPHRSFVAGRSGSIDLVKDGVVTDFAEIDRLRAHHTGRVTRIMNLLQLAPDIQEAILFLPRTVDGHAVHERELRPIAAEADWGKQRRMWLQIDAV